MTPLGALRCLAALPHWARIAIWGTLGARLERTPPEIVQAVIEGDEGFLLGLRSELRGWELPGGNLEPGETDAEALVREVREEVGVEVEVGERVGTYVRTGFRPHTARVYRCRITSGTPHSSAEAHRIAWFDRAAPPRELLPWCRRPYLDAATAAAPVEATEHQGTAQILETMRIDLRTRGEGG